MPDHIVVALKNFLEKQGVKPSEKLLVAVSGGLDSICLLHALKNCHSQLAVIHVNHQLRIEADQDEEWVRSLCQKNSLEFHSCKITVPKRKGFETAARELRYQAFAQYKNNSGANYVLTAHHLNDSLETTLFNLTRGTGLKGLTGIPDRRDFYLRPFSDIHKFELHDYARREQLSYREDKSNKDTAIPRNLIRKKVIPLLEKLTGNFWESYRQTRTNLRHSADLISNLVATWVDQETKKEKNGFSMNKKKFHQQPAILQEEILRHLHQKLHGRHLPPAHLASLKRLIATDQKSKKKEFGDGWFLSVGKIHLTWRKEEPKRKITAKSTNRKSSPLA